MRRQALFGVALGGALVLFAPEGQCLRCQSPGLGDALPEATELDLKGAAETLFVIAGNGPGIESKEFSANVQRLYAQYPSSDWPALRNRLVDMLCTMLTSARELAPETKVAVLQRFSDRLNELDRQEVRSVAQSAPAADADAWRIAGDWESVYNGHLQAAVERIAIEPEGRITIERLSTPSDRGRPPFSGPASNVRLAGDWLSYDVALPSGKKCHVRLEIIYKDLMVGTYSWDDRGGNMSFELRRKGPGETLVGSSQSNAREVMSSKTSNTR
jgi:hypothetical protein